MKRIIFLSVLFLAALSVTGCKTVTASAPLAPGYANPADQTMGQTLAAAHAFYQRIQKDSAAGKVSLSAQEKAALNGLGTAINVASALYLSYHNGQSTQAQAQAAIDNVSTQQTAVQALIPGVK